MTFKPNPGCDIPLPIAFPSVSTFLADLPVEILKRSIPVTGSVEILRIATEVSDLITDLSNQATDAAKRIQEQLDQYNGIVCPLPDVLDKKATGD